MQYYVYEQLIEEVKNLQIGLADTKKQMAKSTAESRKLQLLLEKEREANKETRKWEPSSASKQPGIPTGITDEWGEELFLDDLVRLVTPSSGRFLRLNNFQVGDTVEVYGVTSNYDIRVRDPNNHKLKTVRKGKSVIHIWDPTY